MMVRLVFLAAALTCRETALERLHACMDVCHGYRTASEERACIYRCRDEFRDDVNTCKLED
jgi:hypothetical protein